MASAKTSTLTFRIEPGLKDAVCAAADREHRSIANMIEVMIRDYCERVGLPIEAAPKQPLKVKRKANPRKP